MQIFSPVFEPNGTIPQRYTCDGEDINPPLIFRGIPAATQSLVLIVEDPDVPATMRADQLWVHWVVFNMPPGTMSIGENQEPEGTHGVGTSGNIEYHGPCPPDREHRYFFKLFALDSVLDIPAGSSREDVVKAMTGHIVEEAQLIGRYDRRMI